MKLSFEHGKLYIDNVKQCKYEAQDGTKLSAGIYIAEARYAHAFGKLLPHIDGIGWVGSDAGCQITLGHVRSQSGLIPDGHLVRVLVAAIEAAHETDIQVLAEIV